MPLLQRAATIAPGILSIILASIRTLSEKTATRLQ
jgi:hypothetical protein